MSLPISVIITTKNESDRIERCIAALNDFSEIMVVDSDSSDDTADKAERLGATVVLFKWNGAYPKKRQWCLDHLALKNDWIFFVDADEIVTEKLIEEIKSLFITPPSYAGYFVRGHYVVNGRALRHGLANNKLVLFDRKRIEYPKINDLDLPGMGEMEGHYQPVLKSGSEGKLGQVKAPLLHDAYEAGEAWRSRHARYAAWEAAMNMRNTWPRDPVAWRQGMKQLFRAMPCRPLAAFLHSYIWKMGWLDGKAGLRLALDRRAYYGMIERNERALIKP